MKELIQKIKSWWLTLALREKQAVAVGGSLLAIFLVYECMLSPLMDHVAEMRRQISSDQETLTWMQTADKEIAKVHGANKPNSQTLTPVVLLSVMQKEINHAGLTQYMSQLKQANNDAIQVQFQKISFDKLVSLLLAVLNEQNVNIAQFTVTADNQPGIVNADIVLKI